MSMVSLTFREEKPDDVPAVQKLLRETFWNQYQPGADEHATAAKLRASPDLLGDLTLVGEIDGRIVAHLMGTRAAVDGHESCRIAAFGPICVDPTFQGRGFGSQIIEEAMSRARSKGFRAIAILGHHCYYQRFGLKSSKAFGITDPDGNFPKGQMVAELQPESLQGVSGILRFSDDFAVSEDDIAQAEAGQPPLEKFKTKSQAMFDIACALMADDPDPDDFDPKLIGDRTPV